MVKTTKSYNYLEHTVQGCIDSESMATCVDLTKSVNEPTHQMANLLLVYLSGFLKYVCTYIFITKPILYARELAILLRYFTFPIAINQYSTPQYITGIAN